MARRGRDTPNPRDPDGLTDRQLAFIDHYLGDCKLNASKAAMRAGYAHRQEGARLKANPVIRARIDEYLAASALARDEVLEMLADDALIDVSDAVNDGELSTHIKGDPVTRSAYVSGLLSARTTARGTLAKAYGLLTDKVSVGGGITIRIEGDDGEGV